MVYNRPNIKVVGYRIVYWLCVVVGAVDAGANVHRQSNVPPDTSAAATTSAAAARLPSHSSKLNP